ncbi:MAG TPA: hypothetical protein DCF68_15340 [Cyanothece sp. UBA12306]|nr:hypothetical protein [Cyanothece sp. UBA12306]
MENSNTEKIDFEQLPLLELFSQLQKEGLPLGIGEYQLLIESLRGGFGSPDLKSLLRLCCTLWAKSPQQKLIIERYFKQIVETALEKSIAIPDKEPNKKKKGHLFSRKKLIITYLLFLTVFGSIFCSRQLFLRRKKQALKNALKEAIAFQKNFDIQIMSKFPTLKQVTKGNFIFVVDQYSRDIVIVIFIGGLGSVMLLKGTKKSSFLPKWFNRWLRKRKSPQLSEEEWLEKELLESLGDNLIAPYINSESDEIEKVLLTQENHILATPEYYPIAQRRMKQKWRHLRWLVREGKATELDLKATVKQISAQGFLLNPVLVPPRRNQLQLLLLLDWGGSMLPFQRLGNSLIRTAETAGKLRKVSKYYFNNCPLKYLYHDPYHQEFSLTNQILAQLEPRQTVALIFSDAGALRGGFSQKRIEYTTLFLEQLRSRVVSLAWLNPLPRERWYQTTAGEIARLVPMLPVSEEGFSQTIDVLRGKIRSQKHSATRN